MAENKCDFNEKFALSGGIYECPRCGNHVCRECAAKWSGVCPNCFGRMYRIS